jgi:predicted ester cyclase
MMTPPGDVPREGGAAASPNKQVVGRVVDEVMNGRNFDLIEDLFAPEAGRRARRAFSEFLAAFPDWKEEIQQLVAEGNMVAGRFKCGGTHRGEFMGLEPTGKRMRVDEVFFFEFANGRISRVWGLEDTWERLRQLGALPG